MRTRFSPTTLKLFCPSMTEFEAAAEADAWDIDNASAGDAVSADGNALTPSGGPGPPPFGRGARERPSRRTLALFLPVAISALLAGCGADDGPRSGPPPSVKGPGAASASATWGPATGPGAAAPDVASRFHRRNLLQGPND
jgi:hypothetical protein